MRLSIATKIFIAFAGVIAVFSAVVSLGLFQSQRLSDQIHALHRSIVPLSLLLSDAQNDLKSFDVALSERDPNALHRTLQVARQMSIVPQRFARKLERSIDLASPTLFNALDPDQRLRMKEIHDRLQNLSERAQSLDKHTQRLYTLLQERGTLESLGQISATQNELRHDTRELDNAMTRIRNDLRIITDLSMIRAQEHERSNTYALALMSALALIIALALLGVALLAVTPLQLLADGARAVAQGDYTPIKARRSRLMGEDEITELTHEFNSMANSLQSRDVALKEQHDILLRSERLAAIGRMTSVITHELRNPLSSIGLNAEMLADMLATSSTIDPDDQREMIDHLEVMGQEIDRLHEITEEYLVYARLPSPKFSTINLADLIEQLSDFHQLEWSQHQIELKLELPPGPIHLEADPNQLRQALLNLLKNAAEASVGDGPHPIELTVSPSEAELTLTLRDHGSGLPQDLRPRVFEPFFTSKEQGTGLGLAMTQQIIEGHTGTIRIQDPSDGQGTIFIITLPRQRRPLHPTPKDQHASDDL